MDWKPSFDPVLGRAQRTTPRRFLTSTLFWQGVHVDLVNFVLRYDLERIKRRERWLVKDAGFNAIYAFDLEAMAKLASLAGDDPSPFVEHRRLGGREHRGAHVRRRAVRLLRPTGAGVGEDPRDHADDLLSADRARGR
jgi:hypothetical protein